MLSNMAHLMLSNVNHESVIFSQNMAETVVASNFLYVSNSRTLNHANRHFHCHSSVTLWVDQK